MSAISWEREFWGVVFSGSRPDDPPMLLGSRWHDGRRKVLDTALTEEPTRVLLFKTRREARAWCRQEHEAYKGRQDCCAKWRFRPVRVREIVRPV